MGGAPVHLLAPGLPPAGAPFGPVGPHWGGSQSGLEDWYRGRQFRVHPNHHIPRVRLARVEKVR